jgi:hypothetical protein
MTTTGRIIAANLGVIASNLVFLILIPAFHSYGVSGRSFGALLIASAVVTWIVIFLATKRWAE